MTSLSEWNQAASINGVGMAELIGTFFMGAVISGGLIVAIGSQNAFLLKVGLSNRYPMWAASVCFTGDILLIGAGVFGVGAIFSADTIWRDLLSLGGAAFLFWYGFTALKSAIRGNNSLAVESGDTRPKSLKATLLMAFAMTFLNPHVYIDTVILVGGVTASLPAQQKVWFASGALVASALWFYSLVYVARKLIPVLNKPKTWRVIDTSIALVMFAIAISLLMGV